MNGARLLIALGRERELRRLGLALGKNAFAVRIGRPLEGPQQKGKLGPSAQGVTLLFRARLEAEVANVFAVGDVRAGSVKRVGAAIGEGAAAVAQIHTVL